VSAALRRVIAMIALFGVFLIPLASSSLGGLTQLVTCKATESVGFTLIIPAHGRPSIITSETFTRGAPAPANCPGLDMNLQAGFGRPGAVFIELTINNTTRHAWEGTVVVHLGRLSVPVPVGRVPAHTRRTSRVDVKPGVGAHEVAGQLLVGP
jgi:hypothetical protein